MFFYDSKQLTKLYWVFWVYMGIRVYILSQREREKDHMFPYNFTFCLYI